VTGLRIGWATPWNANSAIAHAASEVAAELARHGHAITVLRTETGDALSLPPRPSPWLVHALAEVPSDHISRAFDVVVAHVGNNYGYHGALIPRLRDLGAVGIFHDAFLADLAAGWAYLPGGAGEQALRCAVREAYGEDGWREDEPFMIAATVLEVARRRPMLEWLAPHTVAAVAHADHYAARLRAACPGPVEVITLAMEFRDLPPPPPTWSRMTVAVIGDANPNKRIDQVILAVAASPVLRRCCRIRVIGSATEEGRERLSAYARTLEIQPPEFTGWVADEELRWQLRDVDVICCLRYPVLEGASASLILALASGRPTLVSNHGCYAEVPDSAVMACTPGAEALDVMRHLERLMADPAAGIAMGLRAQAVATRRHSPAAYAASLLPMLREVIDRRPLRAARHEVIDRRPLRAARHEVIDRRPLRAARQWLGDILGEFGLDRHDPAMLRIDTVLADMQSAENRKKG
jgi:glycosyltransferase involved in cell wall biosynthesis